jgi:hypothetical protein
MELLSLVFIAWITAAIAIFLVTWLVTAPWFILLVLLVVLLAALHFCMPDCKRYLYSDTASSGGISSGSIKALPLANAVSSTSASVSSAKSLAKSLAKSKAETSLAPQKTLNSRPDPKSNSKPASKSNPKSSNLEEATLIYRGTHYSPLHDSPHQAVSVQVALAQAASAQAASARQIETLPTPANVEQIDYSAASTSSRPETEEYVYVEPTRAQTRKVYSLAQRG